MSSSCFDFLGMMTSLTSSYIFFFILSLSFQLILEVDVSCLLVQSRLSRLLSTGILSIDNFLVKILFDNLDLLLSFSKDWFGDTFYEDIEDKLISLLSKS